MYIAHHADADAPAPAYAPWTLLKSQESFLLPWGGVSTYKILLHGEYSSNFESLIYKDVKISNGQ